jgi:hypothetical protein
MVGSGFSLFSMAAKSEICDARRESATRVRLKLKWSQLAYQLLPGFSG